MHPYVAPSSEYGCRGVVRSARKLYGGRSASTLDMQLEVLGGRQEVYLSAA